MRVAIVNTMAPFIWGGAEELAFHLKKNLENVGHEVELIRIPFRWEPVSCIPSQMMMVRGLELPNADKVICLKFPSYMIRHPNKSMWLLHQYRQAYDLFDANQSNIPANAFGDDLRALIRNADIATFSELKKIYVNSLITQNRLKKYNGIASEVLLPPINDAELFTGGPVGDYIFAGGRINNSKRQWLLLESMIHTDKHIKLIIGGPPDSSNDAEKLHSFVKENHLEDRVKLDIRFLPRETYADYINNAMAVAYIPFDEDSLGYVSMEGALAGKPLITTTDSGGILGLVKNGETGIITEPTSHSIAEGMNYLYSKKESLGTMGKSSRELWLSLGINWENTIEVLLK